MDLFARQLAAAIASGEYTTRGLVDNDKLNCPSPIPSRDAKQPHQLGGSGEKPHGVEDAVGSERAHPGFGTGKAQH